jgi:hypothetical protein
MMQIVVDFCSVCRAVSLDLGPRQVVTRTLPAVERMSIGRGRAKLTHLSGASRYALSIVAKDWLC